MNVRLSEGAVRVRVTNAELEALLSSRAVTLEVALPRNHVYRVNVRPAVIGGWALDSDPTGLWIAIPRDDLTGLAGSLPSRSGIEESFELTGGGSVTVVFEVDVRSGREKR